MTSMNQLISFIRNLITIMLLHVNAEVQCDAVIIRELCESRDSCSDNNTIIVCLTHICIYFDQHTHIMYCQYWYIVLC